MAWIFLIIAGFAEIFFVISLKYSQGFKRLTASLMCLIAMGMSLYTLSLALLTIPIGTAYAIWTGIGSVGSVLAGMLFWGESREIKKIIFISCIFVGVIGLKITSY